MDENSFYSLDRLVEFGMGTAIATQMANSMNQSLKTMTIPGAGNPMQGATEQVYYAAIDGQSTGPYDAVDIARLISDGKLFKETYVWKPGMANWDLAENVPDILRLVALTPPPLPE